MRHLTLIALAACTTTPSEPDDSSGADASSDDLPHDTGIPDDSDDDDTAPSDTDSAAPVDTDTDLDSDTPSPLGGTVVSASGAPLGPDVVTMRYCRPAGCLVTDQATGTWGLTDLPPGIGSIEAVDVGGGPRLATFSVPYTLGPGGRTDLVVRVPEITEVASLTSTPTTLVTGPARFQVARLGAFTAAGGLGTVATEVGAVAIAPADLPVIEAIEGEVLGAILLHPFDHLVGGGARVEVLNQWGLQPREGELWVSIYDEARWVRVDDLAYSSGSWLKTDTTLPRTGTLLVVRPPAP